MMAKWVRPPLKADSQVVIVLRFPAGKYPTLAKWWHKLGHRTISRSVCEKLEAVLAGVGGTLPVQELPRAASMPATGDAQQGAPAVPENQSGDAVLAISPTEEGEQKVSDTPVEDESVWELADQFR